MTARSPVPHWPGRMVPLGDGERVYLAETPRSGSQDKDLVLCVHGMTGAATNWTDLMAELSPEFDCAALDLPGSGFSPPPARRSGYSVRALAATVIRLIETITRAAGREADSASKSARVHLIGNSMGGAVAVRVAAARPDLVRTLTLVSPVLPDRRPHRNTMHFPVLALPVIGERLARRFSALPAENRVTGVFDTCYYDSRTLHPDRLALEVAEQRRRDGVGYNDAVIAGAARTLVAETLTPRRLSLWRAAERIEAPALVLFGSHDRLVSPALAAPAARAFRDARVFVLPLTGHIAQMERPSLVAAKFREMVYGGAWTGNSGHRDRVDA